MFEEGLSLFWWGISTPQGTQPLSNLRCVHATPPQVLFFVGDFGTSCSAIITGPFACGICPM